MDEKERSREEQILNKLLRETSRETDQPFERPSDEAVLAYIAGSANDEQLLAVRRALLFSSEFRTEFMELASDIDRLGDPAIQTQIHRLGMSVPVSSRKLSERLKQLLVIPRLVPIAAIATAALVIIVSIKSYNSDTTRTVPSAQSQTQAPTTSNHKPPLELASLETVSESLDPALFSANTTRGTTDGDHYGGAWDDSVAIVSLSKLLGETELIYHVKSVPEPRFDSAVGKGICLRLVDSARSVIHEFNLVLPAYPVDSVTFWLLGIPENTVYRLFRYRTTSDTMVATWSRRMGVEIAITATYFTQRQYRAIPGQTWVW